MKRKFLASIGILSVAGMFARADEIGEKGKAIFKKNQLAVVTVELVLKTRFSRTGGSSGQSSESRQDVTGTVMDESGLTVLSLSATDPGQLFSDMSGGEDRGYKLDT